MDNISNPNAPNYQTPTPDTFNEGVKRFDDFMARPIDEDEPIEKVWEDVAELSKIADQVGVYVINPPIELVDAGRRYFDDKLDTIRKILTAGGAQDRTIMLVLSDYMRALYGFPLKADGGVIENALTAVSPVRAFSVDRYVLFNGVLKQYDAILRFYKDYETHVKREPDPANRQTWFEATRLGTPATDAIAFTWLQQHGFIVVSDFAGVAQEVIQRFLNMMDQKADVGHYLRYYSVAKFALLANDELLAAIDPPRQFATREMAIQYAEEVAAQLREDFDRKADQVGEVLEQAAKGDTPATEIVREVQEAAKAIVRVPEQFALILSRDIYGADGKDAKNILPISRYIEAYLRKRGTDAVHITTTAGDRRVTVTPRTVEKAIEGVNLLQHFQKVNPANGVLRFETNLTAFSQLCGYTDANDEEKLQLLASLMVLNDLYLVVWRSSGLHAVNLLHIPDIGLTGRDKGNIVILVNEDAMRGKPQLISITDFVRLKQLAKGQAKNHFRYQILAKGQSEERALVSQVFGYQYKLDELKDRPDELAKARDDIRKHRSRDTKALQKWFDEYAQLGFISYTRTRNAKGEWIYKWRRLTAPTPEELADVERGKLDTLLLKPSDGETPAVNGGE